MIPAQRLLDRIANDRYSESESSEPTRHDPEMRERELLQRRAFNEGSMHVEGLIHRWINEARLPVALDELRDAEALDLRVKHALIDSPLEIERSPTLSPGTSPAVREVAGGFDVGGPL